MAKADSVTHKFEPIFSNESKVLILGTFPSVKSAEPFLETVSIADGGCNTGYDPREKRFFTEASDCRLGCHPQLYDRRIE